MKISKVLVMLVALLAVSAQASVVFEDFANTDGWNAGVGAGALSGSITSDGDIVSMNYEHGTAVGFDYIDFYTDVPSVSDWSSFDKIEIKGINVPVDAGIFVQLKVYAGNWSEVTFVQNGTDTDYSLLLDYDAGNPSLYNWGPMDWSNVQVVKIHTNGDISDFVTSGTVTIDDIILTGTVPEPATMCLLGLGGFLIRRKK